MQEAIEAVSRLRIDAGVRPAALAEAAGISRSHLSEIEAGLTVPSLDVLARLAAVLGADLSIRTFPGTGPLIRDHLQVAMVEALLRSIHRSWRPRLEVVLPGPARGYADLMLHDPARGQAVEVELHSQLRRVEQQLRWSQAKADALATTLPAGTEVSRLLVLRSTTANRQLVAADSLLFGTAYPSRIADALSALGDATARWPGDVLLWATVDHGEARILTRPPRGIRVGR